MGRMTNLQLFSGCVAIWSTTWLAITYQLGAVAPEMSVAYRFLAASLILFGWCIGRRLPVAFPLQQHAWFALFGALTFSVSYVFVYYAEQHIVSGLVAVGYSASPLLGIAGHAAFLRGADDRAHGGGLDAGHRRHRPRLPARGARLQ